MRKICFIRFGPTSKTLGDRLDPWWYQNNGFDVFFFDISGFYFSKDKIREYYPNKEYIFKGPNHKFFNCKKKFFNELNQFDKSTIILYGNRNPFLIKDDKEILSFLSYKFKNIIPLQFDTSAWNANIFKKTKQYFGLVKHYYNSRNFKFIANIGCGKIGRFYSNQVYKKSRFISIPSPLVIWNKNEKKIINKQYIVFVDENFLYQPDAKIGSIIFCRNIKRYYQRMISLFKYLEDETGYEVVIAASGRYIYDNNFFENRKIIYNKTLSLIHNCEFVLGHCSLALYQAIISNKPINLIHDDEFTSIQKYVNNYMANIVKNKIISNQVLDIKKFYIETPQKNKNSNIIKNYFYENYGNDKIYDYKRIIKDALLKIIES